MNYISHHGWAYALWVYVIMGLAAAAIVAMAIRAKRRQEPEELDRRAKATGLTLAGYVALGFLLWWLLPFLPFADRPAKHRDNS